MGLFTLAQASTSKIYRVKEVLGRGNERRRLLDMGFTPGSRIYIAATAPFGGTLLVSLRGFSVALREDAAKLVELEAPYGI